jgi:hypothetical protein
MSRSRIELRVPPAEKAQVVATARDYGITTSAYLRVLALEDREREKREQMMRKSHPQGREDRPDN